MESGASKRTASERPAGEPPLGALIPPPGNQEALRPRALRSQTTAPSKTAEKPPEKSAAVEAKTGEAAKASAARQRDLDAAISTITKAYGEGSIMRLGDAQALKQIAVIPTGALAVDLALGVGGVPRGRVVEMSRWRARSARARR